MFFIYFFSEEEQRPMFEQGHSAQIKAETPIKALHLWYKLLNIRAGQFKNFTYHAQEIIEPIF